MKYKDVEPVLNIYKKYGFIGRDTLSGAIDVGSGLYTDFRGSNLVYYKLYKSLKSFNDCALPSKTNFKGTGKGAISSSHPVYDGFSYYKRLDFETFYNLLDNDALRMDLAYYFDILEDDSDY
jgi:hypothetical protein